jgi:two-component system chemotaxis response regulator CheB
MWVVEEEDGTSRYQCRVGHAYSEQAFVGAQGERVEAALWTALEVLEERAELLERIAERHASTRPQTTRRMRDAVADAQDRAALLRDALSTGAAERSALDVDGEDILR